MKAIRIHKHGDVDSLVIDNILYPKCMDHQVIVEIKATALNHLDIWVRNGLPGLNIPLPLILGSDASGTIVDVGSRIKNFNIGDDVVIQPGTYINTKGNENYSPNYGILGETEDGAWRETGTGFMG